MVFGLSVGFLSNICRYVYHAGEEFRLLMAETLSDLRWHTAVLDATHIMFG